MQQQYLLHFKLIDVRSFLETKKTFTVLCKIFKAGFMEKILFRMKFYLFNVKMSNLENNPNYSMIKFLGVMLFLNEIQII